MYIGRRIWRFGRVHARTPIARNRPQFGHNLPPQLALQRLYTRHASSLANSLTIPGAPIADIHKGYHSLIDELKLPENKQRTRTLWRSETASILSAEEIDFMIKRLVESGRPFDMDLVVCILADMETFFHLDPKTVQPTIIDALTRAGDCSRLFRWYLWLPKLPGHITASRDQYHALFELCGKQKDAATLPDSVAYMSRSAARPNLDTLRVALQAGFDADVDNDTFLRMFRDLAKALVPFDPAMRILIGENCPDDPIRARRILSLYAKATGSVSKAAYHTYHACERLREESRLKGVKAAIELYRTLQLDENSPQMEKNAAMFAIFAHAQSTGDLELLSQEFDRVLNNRDWAVLIRNLCSYSRINDALFAYRQAKKQGINPDFRIVYPMIKHLCRTSARVPSKRDIDQAYVLYQDLLEAEAASGTAYQPDAALYQSLLSGISASPLVSEYYELGLSIMDDMLARNVALRDSRTASAVIVMMMKYSDSYTAAFHVYRKLRRPLDAVGYVIVLDCFCKLDLGPEPSVQYCFDMIRDMRAARVEVNSRVYSIMLRQFARFYTQPDQRRLLAGDSDLYNRVTSSIRRLHDFLTIDGSFTPDVALWTQLMDTYQRLGCFGDAMRVWDSLYLSGQISGPAVSIIFDACGFAGEEEAARQILVRLDKAGYTMHQNNWQAYVECLCRVGNIDEALRVVCIDMAAAGGVIVPNADTAMIVRKFSRRYGLEGEVNNRIKRYLPEVWKSMMAKELAGGLKHEVYHPG